MFTSRIDHEGIKIKIGLNTNKSKTSQYEEKKMPLSDWTTDYIIDTYLYIAIS